MLMFSINLGCAAMSAMVAGALMASGAPCVLIAINLFSLSVNSLAVILFAINNVKEEEIA